eukprot:scaffold3311_cov411-Prasinococcus_capsulatus_cf.AAC.13
MCVGVVQRKLQSGPSADGKPGGVEKARLLGLTPKPTQTEALQQLAACLVWLGVFSFPLVFTAGDLYTKVFPRSWHEVEGKGTLCQRTVALSCGLLAVVVGQICVLTYQALRRGGYLGSLKAIQKEGARPYDYWEGVMTHIGQPEGILLLGAYLAVTMTLGLMPASYYSFEGGIQWHYVGMQLLSQCVMHRMEHKVHPWVYKQSHKPHHRFLNPRIFDAFNGSLADTVLMILVPLLCTSRLVHCNVWSYMAFGASYSSWLVLIHSEYHHPWDTFFDAIGFGTAADHQVHHKLFVYNYGHLFSYWDRLLGTYKSPSRVKQFNQWS